MAEWLLYIGIGLLFITGILTGGFTTADQQRANFSTESSEDRLQKDKWSTWTALARVVFLLLAAAWHYGVT
ncbi:DUF5316 family protein [Gorillibacterium sp. sgz5001074]|uniref:DUF5316 family protein n=1 Tax=Gorillibacterium sp. sgz5001074 TaxID=3446695 RepID=UPI003F67A368